MTNNSTFGTLPSVTIGAFLRQCRKELGLSLRALAQRVGVDVAYLSRVESDQVSPSSRLLRKLANALDRSEDPLLLLSGRVPERMREMISRQPDRAAAALTGLAEMSVAEPRSAYGAALYAHRGRRAIENGFPFEWLSEVAEVESWRKEVYRPPYHLHKWWAQRLGSVFRAAIIAAAVPKGSSVSDLFYEPVRLPGLVVFDPFMGSGTTVGEAHKLGSTAIGRDINPVAHRAVRLALSTIDRRELDSHFDAVASTAGRIIQRLYESTDSDGAPGRVLYYFWVKHLPCPKCDFRVDLFSSYIFASHASKARHPDAKALCPTCSDLVDCRYDATLVSCGCGAEFDPNSAPARRTTAVCPSCHHEFPIAATARMRGRPPEHRMYAKRILRADGRKEYVPIGSEDADAYSAAGRQLAASDPPLPSGSIPDGHNTRQILNYGYRCWHELFNSRQLLALTTLASSIRALPNGSARDALALLFSGVLEFNNMFASYKGEGTGAVRPMFAHHILKPERTPIEANPWGTPKSSGSFSTLYKSRLLRALEYKNAPFEVAVTYDGAKRRGRKVFGISPPMSGPIHSRHHEGRFQPGASYLSCGNSAQTDLPDRSVDLVVTDPPFFDNVHYSELADFFFVWQQLYFQNGRRSQTTRHAEEVQDKEPERFSKKLRAVFRECSRVLRDDGLLVFSYHHSKDSGWTSLAAAIVGAGFSVVQCYPVKSEMAVAMPKNQAKEPIDLDVLIVCRKRGADLRLRQPTEAALARCIDMGEFQVQRLNEVGLHLSINDTRVVAMSQLLVGLCAGRSAEEVEHSMSVSLPRIAEAVDGVWRSQKVPSPDDLAVRRRQRQSPSLFSATESEREWKRESTSRLGSSVP